MEEEKPEAMDIDEKVGKDDLQLPWVEKYRPQK
jgi:hypothetical protein